MAGTSNIIQVFRRTVGDNEVPDAFYLWACISAIASCVGDRVYYYRFRHAPLYPNLFTFLIGPSGCGKGVAIDSITRFVKDIPRVNFYRGKITAEALTDHMGRNITSKMKEQGIDSAATMFFVTPELANSLGVGARAETFIRFVTDIYGGSQDIIKDGARTRTTRVIVEPCLNWLAGTTTEWLLKSVTQEEILSGFFARVIPVLTGYNYEKRVYKLTYPKDYERLVDYLHMRFEMLSNLEGEFVITPEADVFLNNWYEERPPPRSKLLAASWQRQMEIVFKLSMIFSLADGHDLVIKYKHASVAKQLAEEILRHAFKVAKSASVTKETFGTDEIAEKVRANGVYPHAALLTWAEKELGLNRKLTWERLNSLHEQGKIKMVQLKKPNGRLGDRHWKWNRKSLKVKKAPTESSQPKTQS